MENDGLSNTPSFYPRSGDARRWVMEGASGRFVNDRVHLHDELASNSISSAAFVENDAQVRANHTIVQTSAWPRFADA
jgi:hypothetical protein